MHAARWWALGAIIVGCSTSSAKQGKSPPLPPVSEAPRYEQIWGVATHNSYWVDRGIPDALASGTSERMLDQLLGDGARGVEIDIHKDPDHPHHFLVYHTNPGNSLCRSLGDCLALLRAYHQALPAHAPTLVVLELKEIADANFDADHTFADLDAELRAGLGQALYTPGELLLRCAGLGVFATDLGTCVERARWPDIDALRGRFIVGVLGNWDVVATTTADWVGYANSGIAARAAFPMASTWKLDYASLPDIDQSKISAGDLARAKTQSVLVQVEDTNDPLMSGFLEHGAVVRIDGAATVEDQALRVGLGAQLLQTDTPWIAYEDAGITRPLRSTLPDTVATALDEPGQRLALEGIDDQHLVFAARTRGAGSTTHWETTMVSGHDGTRVGCFRAESASQPRSSITVCRHRHDAPTAMDNQFLDYLVTSCAMGVCSTTTSAPANDLFAERVAIDVENAPAGCLTLSSATAIERGASEAAPFVTFAPIAAPICVDMPLVRQGFARMGGAPGAAWFFASSLREDASAPRPVGAADFDAVVSENIAPTSQESDADAAARLTDWSL